MERIQKIMAEAGIGSRRECEKIIESGRVSVNGKTAKLGDKAETSYNILLDGKPIVTEKKIYINGYTREYIDKDTGNKFLPQQCVFDASKIDFNNEHHVQVLDYKLKNLGFVREQGKIKCTLKKNTVYTLRMIFTYVNGAEEVAFDESSLTPNQKEAIALGLKTIDDFRPRGSIYGNRITQYKISDFDLRDDAADGAYDCGITVSEFDDDKFTIVKEETVETVLEAAMNAPETEDDEDLFA